MLVLALIGSFGLWIAAHFAARKHPHRVHWKLFLLIGIAASLPLIAFSPATFGFGLLLAAALAIWPKVRTRIKSFFPFSILAFVIAYAVASIVGFNHYRELDRYRAEYVYESMEDRLPEPAASIPSSPSVDERLTHLETVVEKERKNWRERRLHELHEDSVRTFVNSPGFGVSRLPVSLPTGLRFGERQQPRKQESSPDAQLFALSATEESDLHHLHESRILDFVNASGFGFVKDRKQVAGFVSHGFGHEREIETKIEATRIELIGLLLHPKPRVYLSDRLPVMEELRAGKTRELDSFEASALQQIREGVELVPGGPGHDSRLVGAIRSGKQCVECHGGKRGDLLGAFSYTLRRVEAKK